MEGLAAARALNVGCVGAGVRDGLARTAGRYVCHLATPADDPEIRRLLRETVFPGAVQISLEREPDSFLAGRLEGDDHQSIVARVRETRHVAAIASRSERWRFVNGTPARVGYLSQLRVDGGFRRRARLLKTGMEFCRELHHEGRATLYLASVVADNDAARRLLSKRRRGWPTFIPVARLSTVMIHVPQRHGSRVADIHITPAAEPEMADVTACLERNNRRYQFAPQWTLDDLELLSSQYHLMAGEFLLASRKGHVVGCVACWDQRACRQVRVRGYSGGLRYVRPFMNALTRWTGLPKLPPVNSRLDFAYASHFAVDDDNEESAVALVNAVCGRAQDKRLEYVAIGLPDGHRLTRAVQRAFRHRAYQSILYVAFWPDGERAAGTLDGRPFLPELAIL